MLTLWSLIILSQQPTFDSTVPWEAVSEEDGLRLERRTVARSASYEYRITARTPASVEQLCTAVFEWGTRGTDVPGLKARKEISGGVDERVVYDQFDAPIVSNRDYAMTVKRVRHVDGSCRIRYWASNDRAPKQLDGWVRLDKLYGSWTFTLREGQTELVYTQFSDPGGSLPVVLTHGTQRARALQSVRIALEKAKAVGK